MNKTSIGIVVLLLAVVALVPNTNRVHAASGSMPPCSSTSQTCTQFYTSNCFLTTGTYATSPTITLVPGLFSMSTELTDAGATANCDGVGSFYSDSFTTGTSLNLSSQANATIWFDDQTFQVPNIGQQSTILTLNGLYHLVGWNAAGGIALAFHPTTDFKPELSVIRSDGYVPLDRIDVSGKWTNPVDAAQIANSWPSVVFSDQTNSFSADYSFSQTVALNAGFSYHVRLAFVSTSSATGFAGTTESANCLMWHQGIGGFPCQHGILSNGVQLPQNPTSACPAGAWVENNQCYYAQWKQTTYTLFDDAPPNPSFSMSASTTSFNLQSSGSSPVIASTTITINANSAITTNCLMVAAYSLLGTTPFAFNIPGQGNVAYVCIQVNGGGTASVTLQIGAPYCTSYVDALVVAAYYSPTLNDSLVIPVTVNNSCAFNISNAQNSLSMPRVGGSASTTVTVTNNGGPNYTCCVTLGANYVNYTNAQNVAINCTVNVSCPSVGYSSPSSGNPITFALNSGASQTATVNTSPLPGTAAQTYGLVTWVAVIVRDNTTNIECFPTACYRVMTIWDNAIFNLSAVSVAVTDFAIIASTSTANAGTAGTSTITVSSVNGFAGNVGLAVTGTSSGLTCAPLSQTTVSVSPTANGQATLQCTATQTGHYTATVTGTNGSLSHQAAAIYNSADFSISPNPGSISLSPTSNPSGTVTVNLSSLNGFSGTVTVTASSPSGITISPVTQNVPLTGTSHYNLTISVSSSVSPGTYTVSLAATSGTLTHPASISVIVPSDFAIVANPATVAVPAGAAASSTLTLTSTATYSVTLSTSVTPPPGGCDPYCPNVILTVNGSVTNPVTVSNGSPVTVNLSVSPNPYTPAGTYTITVTATSGSLTHSATVSLTIQDFTISATPSSLTVMGSGVANYNVTINPRFGYAGTVTLREQPTNSGFACTFSPPSITASGSSAMSCSGNAGSYPFTVEGDASGGLSRTTTVTLNVLDYSIQASQSSNTSGPTRVNNSFSVDNPQNALVLDGQYAYFHADCTGCDFQNAYAYYVMSPSIPQGAAITKVEIIVTGYGSGGGVCFCNGNTEYTLPGHSSVATDVIDITPTVSTWTPANLKYLLIDIPSGVEHVDYVAVRVTYTTPVVIGGSGTGTTSLIVTALNGFTGTVGLSASVSSAGLTCTMNPTTVTLGPPGGSAVSCHGIKGSYNVTVTGTSGTAIHSATIVFIVDDFTISGSPMVFNAGTTGSSNLTITSNDGFAGTVSLSASSTPSGLSCSFNPSSVTLGTSATSTISCNGPPGSYSLTITGTNGTITRSTTFPVTIQDFSLIAKANSLTIPRGSSTTTTVTLSNINPVNFVSQFTSSSSGSSPSSSATTTSLQFFSGTISLNTTVTASASQCSPPRDPCTVPGQPTTSLSPTSVILVSSGSGSSTLTITTTNKTPRGTYTVTITGTSGSISHTATITVTVT